MLKTEDKRPSHVIAHAALEQRSPRAQRCARVADCARARRVSNQKDIRDRGRGTPSLVPPLHGAFAGILEFDARVFVFLECGGDERDENGFDAIRRGRVKKKGMADENGEEKENGGSSSLRLSNVED